MIQKILADQRPTLDKEKFRIHILYPGRILNRKDSGFFGLGRIDHGFLQPGVLVPMHPHQDDETLSYIRRGQLSHKDSEGEEKMISAYRLMMMNAGTGIEHEEHIPSDGKEVEMLQIFLRPEEASLPPLVQFHTFEKAYDVEGWRLIAGNIEEAPLSLRSSCRVYDLRLGTESSIHLPADENSDTFLLYCFQGSVEINQIDTLEKGESMVIEGEDDLLIDGVETADLILLAFNKEATYFKGGMYSGAR
jgi:redox-sensitive bicupin YhaK (pirin superfamily)